MRKYITEESGKTVYNLHFFGLKDLYDYLKSNPQINYRVFSILGSMDKDKSYAGATLEESIEYILQGYKKNLDSFLKANKRLQNSITEYKEDYVVKRSLYAGVPIASLVAANIPDCRLITEPENSLEVRNVYYNLSCEYLTTSSQIENRGLAALYLIQALEARGILVNFKAFSLTNTKTEISNVSIDLKRAGEEKLNIQKCYFPLSSKEFLRRIIFRIMETSDLKDPEWGNGYGHPATQSECREFYKAKPQDIVITSPMETGITGENIYKDTLNMIESLNLEKEFDVKSLKKLSRQ